MLVTFSKFRGQKQLSASRRNYNLSVHRHRKVVLELKYADDLIYRGEGAANLVLAYSGSSPTFVGKVLRIQKPPSIESPGNGYDSEDSHSALMNDECVLWRETEDLVSAPTREIADQLYAQHVISPLLGYEHVDDGICVFLSKEFLEIVEKNILSQRPQRVDAAMVNAQCDIALLMFDSISERSEYNPLDLFSGSKDRMHKAIKALIVTPQNNFRVFLNGSLILGGLGGGADSTSCMIGEAFENVLNGIIQADGGQRTSNILHLVTEAISGSGLLNRLLEVQKLDNIDIEGAIHVYSHTFVKPK